MLIAVVAAGAFLMGVPAIAVAGLVAASLLPVPMALTAVLAIGVVTVGLRVRDRRDPGADESALLRQLSGRVAAGETIRSSISDPSIDAIPVHARRLASLGQPMENVGAAIAQAMPVNGAAFRAICSFSEHTGAAIAHALAVLAERADDATELARQRRIALAQVKLSAVVVGLVPIAASVGLIVLRGVPEPGGAVVVIPMTVGVALQIIGIAVVFTVASKAR